MLSYVVDSQTCPVIQKPHVVPLCLTVLLLLFLRYSAEEIEEKVSSFRLMLQEKQEPPPAATEKPV